MFFQPNQTNDRPKEPHGSVAKGISFSGNEVDFELLWRYISKIRRPTHMATYRKEIENLNNKIVYINSIVQSTMFILVS